MLSLTCTRTSIPASLQAYSHYATSSGSPSCVPPRLLYSITADRCCRRGAPQNPHGRPDMSCRSAPPADQWQKCHLRADLMPGPAAVRRLLQYAVLPAERLCHGPVSFVSSTASRSSGIKIQVIYGKQVISVRERRPNVYYLRNDYESPYIANYTVNDYHYHLMCATDGLK